MQTHELFESSLGGCLGDRMIIFHGRAADANRADNGPVSVQDGHTAGKCDETSI